MLYVDKVLTGLTVETRIKDGIGSFKGILERHIVLNSPTDCLDISRLPSMSTECLVQ